MLLIPLALAGAGILAALSPDAAAAITQRVALYIPKQIRSTSVALWFHGHQSIALVYLSCAVFFVTRTVARLLNK